MMGMTWVVLLVALTGSHLGLCSPLRSTPQTYPHDVPKPLEGWGTEGGLYAAVPALALVLTAAALLFGCTWCYRHKDCKLFTASATHLHDGRRAHPPDSGFSEPANNNISEDNNNGPISLREMQNIANNNAAAYIVSENEERNRVSRESVVEFEPLPTGIRVADPLEHCADWFGDDDFPRARLQYLREIGRGWFGRVVEGEIEESSGTSSVAVKILNQNATLEEKARFLDEARMFRDVRHENILAFIAKCLQEEPWILLFELCSMDLQQYLVQNRPKMAILNESGVPLRIMCDVTAALAHLHSRGYLYGNVWCGSVLVRGNSEEARAVLGQYCAGNVNTEYAAPETRMHPPLYTTSSDVLSLGTFIWEVCAWGTSPTSHPPPLPDLPCPYRNHLYQVMQLCWNPSPECRPTCAQVQALLSHLHSSASSHSAAAHGSEFEARWQRLKPNHIPTRDEHRAIVHAPSTSTAEHFTSDSLSVDMDTAVSRSSSIMSDRDPLSVQIKSESLTNLHGSLDDVRNIYLTHNETPALECHQGNISLDDARERDQDRSDASMDPWLKEIIAGSQDDVSYYKDVSDVIKNLDNILNSEKTSSSESSHQASPSRDNLSLDCKKDYPVQSSMVKSPGITNFQNILDTGFSAKEDDACEDFEADRDTIGTLSHSFERHSENDTTSQHTLENLTPDTPIRDIDVVRTVEITVEVNHPKDTVVDKIADTELPNDIVSSVSEIPKLKELCVASIPSASDELCVRKDCQTSCDSNVKCTDNDETKSIDEIGNVNVTPQLIESKDIDLIIEAVGETTSEIEGELPVKEGIKSLEEESDTNNVSLTEVLVSDLIEQKPDVNCRSDSLVNVVDQRPESVQSMSNESTNVNETETLVEGDTHLPPEEVQNLVKDMSPNIEVTANEIQNHENDNEEYVTQDKHDTEHQSLEMLEESENKMASEVNEYTKWINYASTTQNIRDVSDFINSEREHVSRSEFKNIQNDCLNGDDDDFEVITEKDCLEALVDESQEGDELSAPNVSVPDTKEPEVILKEITSTTSSPDLKMDVETEEVVVSNEITSITSSPDHNLEKFEEAASKQDQVIPITDPTTPNIEHDVTKTENDSEKRDNDVLESADTNKDVAMVTDKHESIVHVSPLVELQTETNTGSNKSEIVEEIITKDETTNISEETPKSLDIHEQVVLRDVSVKSPVKDLTKVEDVIVHIESNEPLIEITQIEQPVATVYDHPQVDTEQVIVSIEPIVQENITSQNIKDNEQGTEKDISVPVVLEHSENSHRSEEVSENSTVYMDLINDTNNEKASDDTAAQHTRDVIESSTSELPDVNNTYVETSNNETHDVVTSNLEDASNNTCDVINSHQESSNSETRDVIKSFPETPNNQKVSSLENNDSTVYMDLPAFETKDFGHFLHMERVFSGNDAEVVSSTPLASDNSNVNSTLENSVKERSDILSETKVPEYGGLSMTKLEQKYIPDNMSPFESPTKSHPTDTYDENSSVVLGPFENCTLELFKGVKSDVADLPKEELLAFSSNFSEINLETPSPLRDGNFLNEVPDIVHDDIQFDDIEDIESEKPASDPTETDSGNSGTEKRISPSTPPNSPGVFLASTSQQKYLVDIDLTPEPVQPEPDLSLEKEIELNQIELQITSKLAMAENENNLNIEYSGPLTVEGLVSEDGMVLRESDALPESFLAGNGGSLEDLREDLTLDEECVKALRNELELKLPLAQVATIEPPCENDTEWSTELPPPPELVVSYPGALSPIAEETGQQLSAYENDMQWNLSIRTDSSESYPEPCNNSTDEVTELPTGAQEHSTYTVNTREPSRDHSQNNTYTVQREFADVGSSREITMSADSLNASPYKKPIIDAESPIDDKTYTKEEEKESLERISQVSPFLLSPTTETSAPDNSDNLDNATGVSTLSKTTLPTDAKHSKPSETQCLSKATSIDSWCSNDTLYNVEENFDDLAMDPEVPYEPEREEPHSESTDTLTHNEEDKEVSHCSTYIIHDSKSEACETFSPDSITANENYTYTKVKTDNAGTTPSIPTTEQNDSTKNTNTKDLAYGTLMSGLPSYSNCTTELVSGFDDWKVQQPELVRRSPMTHVADITPTNTSDDKIVDVTGPQLTSEPAVNKMESINISCLQDNLTDTPNKTDESGTPLEVESPNNAYNYNKNMAPSMTSTPITDANDDTTVEPIPMTLPDSNAEITEDSVNLPNFQTFLQSAEMRPQDISSNETSCVNQDEVLLDSKTLSRNSNRDSLIVSERTPSYSDFESSATTKPQDVKDKSSQSNESGISSEEFQRFENSVRSRPQDLSSLIDASSLLLKSERISSELAMGSIRSDQQTSQENESQSPPKVYLNESHSLVNFREPFLLNFDAEDEQPHSIIITETTMEAFKESPNRTFDSHVNTRSDVTKGYDSHANSPSELLDKDVSQKINGSISQQEEDNLLKIESPIVETVVARTETLNSPLATTSQDVTCNGGSENFATVNFLSETFEELIESNVDESEAKEEEKTESGGLEVPAEVEKSIKEELQESVVKGVSDGGERLTAVTEDFLQNEKKFCQLDSYLPMLSDIRFTGPATEIMSTSFTQESPTDPTSGECRAAADIVKDWDSDSDSHTSNSSSGEFIWKQRTGESHNNGCTRGSGSDGGGASGASDASGDSGSGSEGDEVEFVPSSWDCRAAPAKSSLRSLEQATPVGDNKKRVVFKRQKYHCVYEYPREAADVDAHSPAAYLPDLSTYSEWDPSSAEEAELGYGQLFGAPSPLDMYPLRAGIAFGADYDEDFFISSSARPFESLGIMTSQFFPGKHVKPSLLERDLSDDVTEDFPPPPSPLPTTTLIQTRTPSLDFTTPDSGVEDITPGSTTDEDFKKKLPETELTWRPVDSASSSESVSPSSPGGEALGGLRHTRDKLKLDLPPSPHIPSPRHNRVFNFVLDKPKRREERPEVGTTPLVMTDETPIVTTSLPLQKDEELPVPEPTFSTFGKSAPKVEPEQKLILTDEVEENTEVKEESPTPKVVEAVKGEGTVLDSGDEDSGIESSSKATLERNKTNVS